MHIKWSAVCLMVGVAAGALGCGSYSAPNNNPMSSPDSSSSDSMAPRPGYSSN